MREIQHIVSVSGGKDSTATYLLCLEYAHRHGFDWRAVFADTGHEHPETLEYVHNLGLRTGGPEVEIVRADFSADFARKRMFIARDSRFGCWKDGAKKRWSNSAKRRALEILHPTGVPFLDLCMLKGRFPSTRAQFCTEELKVAPIHQQVIFPALRRGPVLQWVGVRAEESPRRARYPRMERMDTGAYVWRPIHRWTASDVFRMHERHHLAPNPLYKLGMGRVGCMPCINCSKAELAEIAKRFPEEIARVAEWEAIASRASKRGQTTFFSVDKTPGDHTTNHSLPIPGVYEVAEWARTSRGGRQFDLLDGLPAPSCSSIYGLCDAEVISFTQAAE